MTTNSKEHTMDQATALAHVIAHFGGQRLSATSTVFRFPTLDRADMAKAVIDALLPTAFTGEVCATGLLSLGVDVTNLVQTITVRPADIKPGDRLRAYWDGNVEEARTVKKVSVVTYVKVAGEDVEQLLVDEPTQIERTL